MTGAVTLWRLQWSFGHGLRWTPERQCEADSAAAWLAIFQRDEPAVTFRLSAKRPRLIGEAGQ